MPERETLAALIRRYMEDRGLSYQALAKKSGIPKATLHQLARGSISWQKVFQKAAALQAALGIPSEEFEAAVLEMPQEPMAHPYIVTAEPSDCALLVFHSSAREAKALAWQKSSWLQEEAVEFTQVRVRRLPDEPFMRLLPDAIVGIVDDPPSCPECMMWGAETVAGEPCSCCQEDE